MTLDVRRQAAARRQAAEAAHKGAFKLDYWLIAIVVTMLLVGLFMVFSASFPLYGKTTFVKQVQLAVLGVIVCVVVTAIPYTVWRTLAAPAMLFILVGLIAVLVLGGTATRHGADRQLFNGSIQPSELSKLALAIYVAAWADARGRKVASFTEGVLPFFMILGAVAALILLEKSFSVTLIVLVIGLTIYFVAGGNVRQMLLVLAAGLPVLLLAMSTVRYPFERVKGWYNVWFNPSAAPEELLRINSIIEQGRGIGVDPAMWQAKAAVPAIYTDYLFANLTADLHIFGAIAVLALFIAFGYRAITIALNSPTGFGRYLATGIAAWVLVQAAIHIGTSLALIPATGQPLPFMSAGGSALLTCMAAAGLLLSISRQSTEKTTAYATYAWGWRDWWSRLSRSVRSERAPKPAPVVRRAARRRPRPSGSRTMANSVPRVTGRRGADRRPGSR